MSRAPALRDGADHPRVNQVESGEWRVESGQPSVSGAGKRLMNELR